jgi:hypothetical protein
MARRQCGSLLLERKTRSLPISRRSSRHRHCREKNYFLRCLFFISQALWSFGNAPLFSFHAMSNAGSGKDAALPPHPYLRTGLARVLTLTIFQPVSCSQFDNFLLAIAMQSRGARSWASDLPVDAAALGRTRWP